MISTNSGWLKNSKWFISLYDFRMERDPLPPTGWHKNSKWFTPSMISERGLTPAPFIKRSSIKLFLWSSRVLGFRVNHPFQEPLTHICDLEAGYGGCLGSKLWWGGTGIQTPDLLHVSQESQPLRYGGRPFKKSLFLDDPQQQQLPPQVKRES